MKILLSVAVLASASIMSFVSNSNSVENVQLVNAKTELAPPPVTYRAYKLVDSEGVKPTLYIVEKACALHIQSVYPQYYSDGIVYVEYDELANIPTCNPDVLD